MLENRRTFVSQAKHFKPRNTRLAWNSEAILVQTSTKHSSPTFPTLISEKSSHCEISPVASPKEICHLFDNLKKKKSWTSDFDPVSVNQRPTPTRSTSMCHFGKSRWRSQVAPRPCDSGELYRAYTDIGRAAVCVSYVAGGVSAFLRLPFAFRMSNRALNGGKGAAPS